MPIGEGKCASFIGKMTFDVSIKLFAKIEVGFKAAH